MFVLRTICPRFSERNQCIGDNYSIVTPAEKKEFETLMQEWHLGEEFQKLIFAFIICKNGSESIPLYSTHQHFICNENGGTFQKIRQ